MVELEPKSWLFGVFMFGPLIWLLTYMLENLKKDCLDKNGSNGLLNSDDRQKLCDTALDESEDDFDSDDLLDSYKDDYDDYPDYTKSVKDEEVQKVMEYVGKSIREAVDKAFDDRKTETKEEHKMEIDRTVLENAMSVVADWWFNVYYRDKFREIGDGDYKNIVERAKASLQEKFVEEIEEEIDTGGDLIGPGYLLYQIILTTEMATEYNGEAEDAARRIALAHLSEVYNITNSTIETSDFCQSINRE